MAQHTVDSLTKRLASLHGHYQREYAGLPRHNRPLEPLARLVEKTTDILKRVKKLKGEPARKLEATVVERLKLYTSERDAIAEAQSVSEAEIEGRDLAVQLQLATGRYRRHFAGHDRRTRDLGLLLELTGDLRRIEERLGQLASLERTTEMTGRHEAARTQREVCEAESIAIPAARRELSLAERADLLAALANRQFALYREQFEGRPRPTCRPALLRRIIAALEESLDEMKDPAFAGLEDGSRHRANVPIVSEQLDRYRAELVALEAAHSASALDARVGLLGGAANEMMTLYRDHFAGKERATRNLVLLGIVCDRLGEIERQMSEVANLSRSAANRRNLTLVRQNLRAYEDEHARIAESQGTRPTSGAASRPLDPLNGLIRTGS